MSMKPGVAFREDRAMICEGYKDGGSLDSRVAGNLKFSGRIDIKALL